MKGIFALIFASLFLLGFVMAAGNGAGNGLSDDDSSNGMMYQSGDSEDSEEPMLIMAREKVMAGEYESEDGQRIMVKETEQKRLRIEANGTYANCEEDCNMTQEKDKNKTKLHVTLSNGRNAEIKVMPNTASETALNRLRLKVCNESNNCSIELKEVGTGNQSKLAYEVQIERHSRILGIFQAKMQVRTQVNAENGEVIQTNKPWWAFLATEPAEQ